MALGYRLERWVISKRVNLFNAIWDSNLDNTVSADILAAHGTRSTSDTLMTTKSYITFFSKYRELFVISNMFSLMGHIYLEMARRLRSQCIFVTLVFNLSAKIIIISQNRQRVSSIVLYGIKFEIHCCAQAQKQMPVFSYSILPRWSRA